MIELIQHIESLLLNNNCVIIPQFGGFVAHHAPARWLEDEGIYLPPARTIGFNPQLKINDGLLIQSYMQTYGTDFSDASKRVEKDVKELIRVLHERGKVELPGIGEISLDMDNSYGFNPAEDGIPTPEFYGLSSFEIEEWKAIQKEIEITVPNKDSNKNVYEIRINRTFLRNTVAAAVAVIAFFFLSTPVENTYIEADNYAGLLPVGMFGTHPDNTETPKVNVPVKPKAVRVEKVSQPAVLVKTADTKQPKELSSAQGKYNIIVASVKNRSEAETFILKCQKEGYPDASVLEGDGRTRVSLISFTNKNEAYNALNKIRQNPVFKDAWLLSK